MSIKRSYCGYRCDLCAARSDDPEIRHKLVEGWKMYLGHEMYTVENVHCDGCCANGKHADQQCQVRPCAISHDVETCAECDEFVCEKVGRLLGERMGTMIFLHKCMKNMSEEEYNLCLRQFENMPEIVKLMVKAGKLPSWVLINHPGDD
jgi:hypothetical protein